MTHFQLIHGKRFVKTRNSTVRICMKSHPILVKAFPGSTYTSTNVHMNSQCTCISLSDSDVSSPRALGRKVLEEITPICQKQFNMSPQEVLQSAPKSQLIQKPSSVECQTKKRQLVREVKQAIRSEMDKTDVDNVMSNRISWSAFDRMRKEALCSPHKRRAQDVYPNQKSGIGRNR